MNCDCPRSTGIIHYEECPMHDSHSCAVCETENHGNKLIAKQARAEVLAACIERANKMAEEYPDGSGEQRAAHGVATELLLFLQPAASDLEELCDKAHAAGAVIAGEQLLKSLTPGGGDFAVGSPLAKVKQRVEALLREAELKGRITQLEAMKGEDAGGMWFPDPGKLTVNDRIDELKAELEKARASEGASK
ncbi:hypothetical protein LCGC14_2519230 [marine sediment metagenome]|uniref:Uncharacterized protein n=1 Tax=marine sediment metagenome TaxID=412755 RepID=A0A0F9AWX2_9ZZZZ